MPEPREQLREMIADKLRGCPSGRFNIPTMADEVMELFSTVEHVELRVPKRGPIGSDEWEPYQYFAARTKPEPVSEPVPVEETPQ